MLVNINNRTNDFIIKGMLLIESTFLCKKIYYTYYVMKIFIYVY